MSKSTRSVLDARVQARNTEQMDDFRQRLKKLRVAARLTQEQLALKCGWSGQSRVSNYEAGTRAPDLGDIRRLAAALDITTAELVGEDLSVDPASIAVPMVLRELIRSLTANMPGVAKDFAVLFERQARHSKLPIDVDLAAELLRIVELGQGNAAAAVASASQQLSVRRSK